MKNPDHYAIVIGLWDYKGFTPPADLAGPQHDADSIYAWLTHENRGGLQKDHVKLVKSSDEVPPDLKPTSEKLGEAFKWVDQFAKANKAAGLGRRVGKRLYFYVSGHGFSPQIKQGCLLAGNASPEEVSANIGASLWLQWWQDAGYFQEYVLLMDCCMNRMPAAVAEPQKPPLIALAGSDASGPAFVAFAAQRPLKAVEVAIPEDGGTFHGAFTWAFLKGLEGAAANSSGVVTGHSMGNWLRNAILPWLGEADRNDPQVSKEPEIVAEDPKLIFARGVAPLLFDIKLKFPADAVGKPARIWSGTPAQPTEFVADALTPRLLPAGLNLVEVPLAGYRQGIEVVRAGEHDITKKGASVVPPLPGKFSSLVVTLEDAAADISIAAADFEVVDAAEGRIESKLPFGLYKVQIRTAGQITTRVILLDADMTLSSFEPVLEGALESIQPNQATRHQIRLPKVTSAVPFRDAFMSHEYQSEAASLALAAPALETAGAGGAELLVMARSWSEAGASPDARPWQGVRIVNAVGDVVVDLEDKGFQTADLDPFAIRTIAIDPGTYFLRYPLGPGQQLEQALVAVAGWRLETYLLKRSSAPTAGQDQDLRPSLSLLMRRSGQPKIGVLPWEQERRPLGVEDERLESARTALAAERPIFNARLEALLIHKFQNPIEGIIGGHLLLIQNEHDGSVGLELLDEVVANLRTLVGTSHPDVEALSLRCRSPKLRRMEPLLTPPMFERSWRLIVEASQRNAGLVPLSVWERVHALAPLPPFLAWSVDPAVQKAYRGALVKIALGQTRARPATRRAKPELALTLKSKPALESARTFDLDIGPAAGAGEAMLESLSPPTLQVLREPRAKSTRQSRDVLRLSQILQLPPNAVRALLDKQDG